MIYVSAAVGINASQQRHDVRQIAEVIPVDEDARGRGDGNDMQRVIRRPARRVQADDRIDDAALIDDCAIGKYSSPRTVMRAARLVAEMVSASRKGVFGGINALPGRCSPMISISI